MPSQRTTHVATRIPPACGEHARGGGGARRGSDPRAEGGTVRACDGAARLRRSRRPRTRSRRPSSSAPTPETGGTQLRRRRRRGTRSPRAGGRRARLPAAREKPGQRLPAGYAENAYLRRLTEPCRKHRVEERADRARRVHGLEVDGAAQRRPPGHRAQRLGERGDDERRGEERPARVRGIVQSAAVELERDGDEAGDRRRSDTAVSRRRRLIPDRDRPSERGPRLVEQVPLTGAQRERLRATGRQHLRRHPDRSRRRSASSSGSCRRLGAARRGTRTRPAGGFDPAARNAWIAHAVDCASDSRPRDERKAPVRVPDDGERRARGAIGAARRRRPRGAPGPQLRCRSSPAQRPAPTPSRPIAPAGRSARRRGARRGRPAWRSARTVQMTVFVCPAAMRQRRAQARPSPSAAAARAHEGRDVGAGIASRGVLPARYSSAAPRSLARGDAARAPPRR